MIYKNFIINRFENAGLKINNLVYNYRENKWDITCTWGNMNWIVDEKKLITSKNKAVREVSLHHKCLTSDHRLPWIRRWFCLFPAEVPASLCRVYCRCYQIFSSPLSGCQSLFSAACLLLEPCKTCYWPKQIK